MRSCPRARLAGCARSGRALRCNRGGCLWQAGSWSRSLPLGGSCRLLGVLAADLDPFGGPGDCELLRHGPGARVVEHDVADAARAELREDRVEAPAAVAEGLCVGAIAERDDAVLHAGEVRTLALQRRVEMLRVVRDIALPVCRGADQEQAAWR